MADASQNQRRRTEGCNQFCSLSLNEDFPIKINVDLRWTSCPNSSGDWLMVLDHLSNLHMLNPLAGRHIPLPPFKDKQYIVKAIVGWTDDTSFTTIVVTCSRWCHTEVAFTRSGDKEWTSLLQNCYSVDDIIYHKGDFLALSLDGSVEVYEFCTGRHGKPVVTNIAGCLEVPIPDSQLCERHLLRLSGKLFQVLRIVDDYNWPDRLKTLRFEVYKKTHRSWTKVEDLGGRSLFLGDNHTISVSACHSAGLQGNCIYFPHKYLNIPAGCREEIHAVGVFSLEDGSLSTYCPDKKRFTWPLPIWFMPNLSFGLVGNQRKRNRQREAQKERILKRKRREEQEARYLEKRRVREKRRAENEHNGMLGLRKCSNQNLSYSKDMETKGMTHTCHSEESGGEKRKVDRKEEEVNQQLKRQKEMKWKGKLKIKEVADRSQPKRRTREKRELDGILHITKCSNQDLSNSESD